MNSGDFPSSQPERLDAATAQRLAKLALAEVDVSHLMAAIAQRVPRRPLAMTPASRTGLNLWQWLTPLRAAAAGMTFFALTLALVLYASSRPAQASAQMLVDYHQKMTCGMDCCLPADSVASGNATLAREAPDAPRLPELATTDLNCRCCCCCVHRQGRAQVSCLCCQADGQRLTLVVGDQRQIRPPAAPAQNIGGVLCRVTSAQGMNLCTTEHGDRWVCVISSLPVERLAELAGAMRW